MSEARDVLIALSGGFTVQEAAAIQAAVPRYVAAYRFLNRPFDPSESAHTKLPKLTADQILFEHGITWRYRRGRIRLCDIYGAVIELGMAEVGGPLVYGEPATSYGRCHLPPDLDDRVAQMFHAGTHHKQIAANLRVSVVTVYRRIALMRQAGIIHP